MARLDALGGNALAVKVGAALAVVAVVATVGLAAAAVGFGVVDLGGGGGGGASDAVKQVPDGVDAVNRVDGDVLQDDAVNRVYSKAYERTYADEEASPPGTEDVPEDIPALTDRIQEETGLDPQAVDEFVTFRKYRQNYTETRYRGYIVHADWDQDDVVDAVSGEDSQYTETTVEGHTVYKPPETEDEEFSFEPAPDQWVGVIGEGEYVIGSPEAVTDTLEVAEGEHEPIDGPLLSAYKHTQSGYLRYARRAQNLNVSRLEARSGESTALNVTKYGREYNGLHISAGSYYRTDDGFGSEARFLSNRTSTAKDVKSLVQGALSIQAGAVQNATLERQLRSTSVSRDGTTVTVERTLTTDETVQILAWYLESLRTGSTTGAAPGPGAGGVPLG